GVPVKPFFFLAVLMTTQVLTTAVAAQEGGDVPICRPIHGTPTPVNDVSQCPGGADPDHPEHCGPHCIVDISGMPVGERAPEQTLKDALLRCNTTVRLGPDIKLDYFQNIPSVASASVQPMCDAYERQRFQISDLGGADAAKPWARTSLWRAGVMEVLSLRRM